ncbi:ABC transporter substrate-binding protein [bacterium LRH843]|nr:ABC transporter substrate-binding protein [bacterium LRH843]
MKKKRFLTSMLTVLTVGSILAGCAGGTSDTSQEATTSTKNANEEKVELTFWYPFTGKIQEANEGLVEKFNESQDRIHVTASSQGNYADVEQKVRQSIVAGNQPDVFITVINSVSGLAKDGVTENLSPLMEADKEFKIDDFIEGIVASSNVDGNYRGLPYFNSTPLVYFNKNLFEEAGVSPEQLSTWDGFQDAATKLTKDGVIGGTQGETFWIYEANMNQKNGQLFSEDKTKSQFASDEGVASADFILDMVKDGSWQFPVGNQGTEQAQQAFQTGKAGMLFASTANLSTYLESSEAAGFELGAAMLPEGDKRAVAVGGSNIVMTAGLDEEKKQAAWEFIEFMTNTESNAWASEYTGYLPIRHSVAESEERKALEKEQPLYAVAREQLQYAVPAASVPGFSEITNIWRESVEALIADQNLSTKEAMETADQRATSVLNK